MLCISCGLKYNGIDISHHNSVDYLPVVYYGDLNGFRLRPTARKCKSWYRTLWWHRFLPAKFQQVAVESKYGGPIDTEK